jgi:hypothetical protein
MYTMPPSTFSKAKLSIMQHMLEHFLEDDKLPQQRRVIYKERVRRLTIARRRATTASIRQQLGGDGGFRRAYRVEYVDFKELCHILAPSLNYVDMHQETNFVPDTYIDGNEKFPLKEVDDYNVDNNEDTVNKPKSTIFDDVDEVEVATATSSQPIDKSNRNDKVLNNVDITGTESSDALGILDKSNEEDVTEKQLENQIFNPIQYIDSYCNKDATAMILS